MSEEKYSVGFVTVGSVENAQTIADFLVEQKLAACCNILHGCESTYTWNGKIEKASEVLMIIKTKNSLEQKVIQAVKQLHSYQVPEVIFTAIHNGNPDYLKWIDDSVG